MNERGFTVAELIVATVVMALLGTALARILIGDSRFVSQLDARMNARIASRAAVTAMVLEFRMVSDGGLINAAPESVTVRVPYAFGLLCQTSGASTVMSLLPADSLSYASAVIGGLAWLDSTDSYVFMDGMNVAPSANTAACTQDSIRTVPGGQLVQTSSSTGAPSGSVAYLYQTVTYRFAPSVDIPGRRALWRQAGTAAAEELVAPFDTAAGFGFLVGESLIPQPNPPMDLSTVRGLELRLVGASERNPEGKSKPETFDLRTTVVFLNKT